MSDVISFPKNCMVCDELTQSYQLLLNEYEPNALEQYMCNRCFNSYQSFQKVCKMMDIDERRKGLKLL